MIKKAVLLLINCLLLLSLTGCFRHVVRVEGPFKGRVVDAETGEPIEGVVVLGVWYKDIPTVAGGLTKFYDVEETVTDYKGNFTMPGKTIRLFSNLDQVTITVFKAGYNYATGSKYSFKEGFYYPKIVKWEGSRAIIPLRKLTMQERKKERPPIPPTEAPLEKIRLTLEEINKNEIELGAEPYDIWGGKKVNENKNP